MQKNTKPLHTRRIIMYYRFKAVNMSFTVSPVGHAPMPGPLQITYEQMNFDPDPEDTISMLLHWNPGKVLASFRLNMLNCRIK